MDTVMGLDISMRSTGVAIVNTSDYALLYSGTVGSNADPSYDPEIDCILRASPQAELIRAKMAEFAPKALVIEGPAYGATVPVKTPRGLIMRPTNRICQLWQLTGALKFSIIPGFHGFIRIVTPAQLKKHITGKGRAEKIDMIKAIKTRFGIDFRDDNQCDAFCLCVYHLDKMKRKTKRKNERG